MLPIIGADIYYPDGSVYRIPDDGTWAEAPPFGVQCIVWYHVEGLKTITSGRDIYYHEEDFEGLPQKVGLFMDVDGYYRIVQKAFDGSWEVKP